MQAHVIIAAAEPVERIQAADHGVPLENAHRFFVIGQTDACGQARHSGADDRDIVGHGRCAYADACAPLRIGDR